VTGLDPSPPDPDSPEDIRVLVPRVRRAVEGIGTPEVLTDDQMKDLIADAIADVILFTGTAFGKQLLVTDRDGTTNVPTEYATSLPLTLPEGSVIAAQAALTAIYVQLADTKTSETIRDEGQEWSYTISATLLRDRISQLQAERDRALSVVEQVTSTVEFYNLWLERDVAFAAAYGPYYELVPPYETYP
jgi:hypothetical protein